MIDANDFNNIKRYSENMIKQAINFLIPDILSYRNTVSDNEIENYFKRNVTAFINFSYLSNDDNREKVKKEVLSEFINCVDCLISEYHNNTLQLNPNIWKKKTAIKEEIIKFKNGEIKMKNINMRMVDDKHLKENQEIGAKNYIEVKCPNCGAIDKLWYDEDNFNLKILAVECKKCHSECALKYNSNTKLFS